MGTDFKRLLTVRMDKRLGEGQDLKRERHMQRTIRPSLLLVRYGLQEITPRCLEFKITHDRSNAFEFRGQRIQGTRVVWRALSDILGVQRKQIVHLGIRCIGNEEFFQVSAQIRFGPANTP